MLGKSRIGIIILMVAIGLVLGGLFLFATDTAVAASDITITSSPAVGSGFVEVDGTARETPYPVSWEPGTSHEISAVSVITIGTGERYEFDSWNDTGSRTHTIIVPDSSATYTASFTQQFQLTMAATSGTVSPATGSWFNAGSSVGITANPPDSGTGERYLFAGWTGSGTLSYDGTNNPATVTMNGPISETATWTRQYRVSFAVSPAGAGSTSPEGTNVWVDAGPLSIVATPATDYTFSSWSSGTGSITFNPQAASTTATINGPGTITANYVHLPVGITVTSSPAGSGYVLVDGDPYVTPHTFQWVPGETYDISAVSVHPIGTGERYAFDFWSDAGSPTHTYTVPVTPSTVTAFFTHQYQLTTSSNVGTVSPVTGTWHDAGSSVGITATAPTTGLGERYLFAGWVGSGTGSYTGTTNAVTVIMSDPVTETATWTRQYQVSFAVSPAGAGSTSPEGTNVWVNAGPLSIVATPATDYTFSSWSSGTGSITFNSQAASTTANIGGTGTVTAIFTQQFQLTMASNYGTVSPVTGTWHDAGAQVTITATPPDSGTGEQYLFAGWTGSGTGSYTGTDNDHASVTMNGPITETASWTRQYRVSFAVSPAGAGSTSPGGINVWVDAGPLSIVATPATDYAFSSWSSGTGSITFNSQAASTTATINGPGTITANFVQALGITITSSPAVGSGYILVDGIPITTPHTFKDWFFSGTPHTIQAVSARAGEPGEQYVFNSWSDGGARTHIYIVTNPTATITANFAHQYLVTMMTNGGTTTPAVGTHWYDSGSQFTLDASAQSAGTGIRYVWDAWTGTGTGSYSGTNKLASNAVTVSGPITQTASWTTQYYVSFATSPSVGGTTTPSVGTWSVPGPLSIQATPSSSYAFSSWGSDTSLITFTAQTASTNAIIGGPGTITATFTLQPVGVTITSNPVGTGYVMVDEILTETPHTFNWLPGSSHSLEATVSLSVGTGEMYSFSTWSDVGARVHSYIVTAAVTVTANFAHQYLVTMVTNGGTTTPAVGTHWYDSGSQLTLDAAAPTAGRGMRYVWEAWTGTGTGSYSGTNKLASNAVTVSGPISQTANWTTQYQVSFAITPVGGGTTTPAGTGLWYNAGSLLIQATSANDYAFSTWTSGSASVTFNAQTASTTAAINGPGTITANFVLALGITITSSPTGSGYLLIDGSQITTPANFKWTAGTAHSIQAISTVPGAFGERYVFKSWSDGLARTHTYTVTALTATLIANFDHQYLLTMLTSTGTTTPAADGTVTWKIAGSIIGINATAPSVGSANERYQWAGWTGSGSGNYSGTADSPAVDIMMNGPITETANWSHQYLVTISTNYGTTDPATGNQWVVDGSSIYLTATAPTADASERFIFNGWVGTGSGSYTGLINPSANAILVNGPITETASWTRHQVPDAPGDLMANSGDGFVNLNWTAPADGGLTIDHYVVYQDGAQVATVTAPTAMISGLTNDQSYSFTVAAHNLIGNGPNSTTAVIKPMKGPNGLVLEITSPLAGSYGRNGSVLLEWTVSDLSSSVVKTEVSQDGTNWSTVTGTSQQFIGLADGTYLLFVRATDAANNVLTRSVSVLVDTTAPTVIITAPTYGAFLPSQTVTVTWSIIEQVSGLAKIEMGSDGTNWTVQTGNTGSLMAGDGAGEVWVQVTDNAGNVMNVMVPFTVDMTAPTLLTRSPTGSAESTLTSVTVTFNEAMNRSSTSISVRDIQGTALWNGDNLTFSPSEVLLGMTTYSVTVNGMDLAGNTAWENWTFQTAVVGKISGILYDHKGKALPNTIVRLIGQSTAAQTEMWHFNLATSTTGDNVRETMSDAKGAFAFYDVAIGNYALEFTEIGYLTKSMAVAMTLETAAIGGLEVTPGRLSVDPNNGIMFLLAVGAVCAAMAGAVILLGRRRIWPSILSTRPAEVEERTPEEAEGGRPGSDLTGLPAKKYGPADEKGKWSDILALIGRQKDRKR